MTPLEVARLMDRVDYLDAQLSLAREEIERLREQLGQMTLADYMKGEEITRREATEKRLREALVKYGQHDDGCGKLRNGAEFGLSSHVTGPCTCGFLAALAGLAEDEPRRTS
jgi:hypothetical protein